MKAERRATGPVPMPRKSPERGGGGGVWEKWAEVGSGLKSVQGRPGGSWVMKVPWPAGAVEPQDICSESS